MSAITDYVKHSTYELLLFLNREEITANFPSTDTDINLNNPLWLRGIGYFASNRYLKSAASLKYSEDKNPWIFHQLSPDLQNQLFKVDSAAKRVKTLVDLVKEIEIEVQKNADMNQELVFLQLKSFKTNQILRTPY